MVTSIIGFLIMLCPLVVIHELGHLLFAKWFNVKAEAFSVGFGKVLFQKKWGETEYRFSLIPLGGYVKLLGEDPTTKLSSEDEGRALHQAKRWQRFFIFLGGPLFNFIWAAVVFMIMMAIGEPQVSSKIGRVLEGSPAAVAGIKAGDRIVAINNQPVERFEEWVQQVSHLPNKDVLIEVDRAGQNLTFEIRTTADQGFSMYGEEKEVGVMEGVYPNPRSLVIGVADPKSPAALAGLKTGDELVSWNGLTFPDFEAFEFNQDQPTEVVVVARRGQEMVNATLKVAKRIGNFSQDFGLYSAENFVDQTLKDSPAAKAGLQKGDRLVAVNGKEVKSFVQLRSLIQSSGESSGQIKLTFQRAGEMMTLDLTPSKSTERDPTLKKRVQYTIGIMPFQVLKEADSMIERTWNPFVLVYKGFARMIDLSIRNMVSIGKMIAGQVSVNSLGGPILIGKLAGDSLSRGLLDFLRMMAILSIGLGVLNILPIPVLDGGHIALLAIESVRGRALSLKQMEIIQQVGLAIVLMIMVVVMKNDITRLPIFQ